MYTNPVPAMQTKPQHDKHAVWHNSLSVPGQDKLVKLWQEVVQHNKWQELESEELSSWMSSYDCGCLTCCEQKQTCGWILVVIMMVQHRLVLSRSLFIA